MEFKLTANGVTVSVSMPAFDAGSMPSGTKPPTPAHWGKFVEAVLLSAETIPGYNTPVTTPAKTAK